MTANSSAVSIPLSVHWSYRAISRYHSNNIFLTTYAMRELRSHLSFTQLRFHCSKQQGRTFHVTTAANSSGEAVVKYFSGQTDVQPESCGSFVRMEDDNSKLAKICHQWGVEGEVKHNVSKWSSSHRYENRLYYHTVIVWYSYHWLIKPSVKRLECDDFWAGVSSGDFWKVFVR